MSDTVKKYLLNEGKVGTGIIKVVAIWQKEQLKLSKKFAVQIKKVISTMDNLEELEDFRDMGLNNLAITPELEYALRDVIDERIDQLWQEDWKKDL